MGFVGLAAPALAQTGAAQQRVNVDIPAQDLNSALLSLAQRAHIQLVYDVANVRGKRSAAVRGDLTVKEALNRLLAGTGYSARFTGGNRVQLVAAGATRVPRPSTTPRRARTQASDIARDDHQEIVVTASGFEQRVIDAPASISVVSREELENRQFSSLHDALVDVPGVAIVGGSDGEGSGISIRGMESGQSLILIDGRRSNSSEANPRGGGGDLESNWVPPLQAIERIEVVRGPMSSLYGADAVGGVINVITRKVPQRWMGSLQAAYLLQGHDAVGDQKQVDAYLAGPVVPGLIGIQAWGYDKHRDEDAMPDAVQESDKWSATGRLWITPTPDHDVMFEYGVQRQDYSRSAARSGDGADANYRYDRDSWAIAHNGRWGFGTSSIQFYEEKTERTSALTATPIPTNATNSVLDAKFTVPFANHVATIGYQWMRTKSDKSDFKDLGDPTSTYGTRTVKQSDYFIEDEWTVLPDLSLTGGVRLTDHEVYGNHWSPRGYAVWRIDRHFTLKGGVGTGYKAPEIREIEPGTGATQARGAILAFGNPDLKPEASTSYELGLYYTNDALRLSATLFNNDFKNKIINTASYAFYYADGTRIPARGDCVMADPPTSACPGWGSWLNLPGARVRGVELDGRWQITPELDLRAAYTYSDSRIRTGDLFVTAPNGEEIPFLPGGIDGLNGQPLAGVPKHRATGTLNWEPINGVRAYVRGLHESKVTSVSFGQGNSVRFQPKSLTTFDLGGSWRINENVTLSAVIYNITDQVRYDPDLVGEAGLYQFPEDGRRFWLSMRASF
ncbi:MAG: TonB-dependent receptor [Novosphingobium sp.]